MIIIITQVQFLLDLIIPFYRSGSSLVALLSVPLEAFLLNGWVPVLTLDGPSGSLQTRLSYGDHSCDFLRDRVSGFLWPVIATFHMAMPFESMGMEYLCKIIELHPRLAFLWADLIFGGDCTSSRGCRSDEVGGLGFFLHGAWHPWCMYYGFFLCRWLEMSERWGWAEAQWICPMRHSIF